MNNTIKFPTMDAINGMPGSCVIFHKNISYINVKRTCVPQ